MLVLTSVSLVSAYQTPNHFDKSMIINAGEPFTISLIEPDPGDGWEYTGESYLINKERIPPTKYPYSEYTTEFTFKIDDPGIYKLNFNHHGTIEYPSHNSATYIIKVR